MINKKGLLELGKYTIAIILSGLFFVSLFWYHVYLAQDNLANVSIISNDRVNRSYIAINESLIQARDSVNQNQSSFLANIPFFGESIATVQGIWTIGTGFLTGFIPAIYETFVGLARETFDIPESVFISIIAIFILIGLFVLYQALRTGQ